MGQPACRVLGDNILTVVSSWDTLLALQLKVMHGASTAPAMHLCPHTMALTAVLGVVTIMTISMSMSMSMSMAGQASMSMHLHIRMHRSMMPHPW